MRGDFSNGLGWQSDFFPTGSANERWFFPTGPANERWFFQRAGKWEVIFPTGRAGPPKEKWIFQRLGRSTKKRRRLILLVSPGRQNKLADKRIRMYPNVSNDLKCKCVFQFSLQDYKQNSIDFFNSYYRRFITYMPFSLFITRTYSYAFWKSSDAYV